MRAVNASFDITLCSKILFSAQNYNGTITSLEKYLFIFNQIAKIVQVNRDM